MACIGGGLLSTVLASCQSTHYVTGVIESKSLTILKSEFTYSKKDEQLVRQYIIVNHDTLEYPIYLYRISDNEYSALWMKCTHQGSELQAAGDHLYCSSHGSEFDKKGNVSQGPAEKNLRSFPVSILNDKIFIELT
jgi:Rieske Fe-S protein